MRKTATKTVKRLEGISSVKIKRTERAYLGQITMLGKDRSVQKPKRKESV